MPKLTKQQEKLARARVKHPTATLKELAVKAQYSEPQNAFNALHRPHVKARVQELMDMSPKLQLPSLLKKLEEGLEAKETKFFQENGRVTDSRSVVDFSNRKSYLDVALDLRGLKEKTQASVTNNFFSKDALEIFLDAYQSRTDRA